VCQYACPCTCYEVRIASPSPRISEITYAFFIDQDSGIHIKLRPNTTAVSFAQQHAQIHHPVLSRQKSGCSSGPRLNRKFWRVWNHPERHWLVWFLIAGRKRKERLA